MKDLIVQGLTVKEYNRLKELEKGMNDHSIVVETSFYFNKSTIYYKDGAVDKALVDQIETLRGSISDLNTEIYDKGVEISHFKQDVDSLKEKLSKKHYNDEVATAKYKIKLTLTVLASIALGSIMHSLYMTIN